MMEPGITQDKSHSVYTYTENDNIAEDGKIPFAFTQLPNLKLLFMSKCTAVYAYLSPFEVLTNLAINRRKLWSQQDK